MMEGEDYEQEDPSQQEGDEARAIEPTVNAGERISKSTIVARALDVNKDLQIFVSDPEKHGDDMNAYVSYCVTTKTTLSVFESSELAVRRRFSDFVLLRSKLVKSFPSVIIPPMPSKDKTKFTKFNVAFLEKRRVYLERFLRRCSTHPQLSQSKELYQFLEAKKWELDSTKKRETFTNLKENISQRYAGLKLKNADTRFVNLRNHVNALNDRLSSLEKIGNNLQKHQQGLAQDFATKYPIFSLLANSENEMCDLLTQLSSDFEKLAAITDDFAENLDAKYNEPLYEYMLYADSAIELLKKRDVFEQAFDSAQDNLTKKENERQKAQASDGKGLAGFFSKKSPEVLKQEKLDTLAKQIAEGEERVKTTEEELKRKDEEVLVEFEFWHKNKATDLKNIITDYVDVTLDFHSQSLELLKKMSVGLDQ